VIGDAAGIIDLCAANACGSFLLTPNADSSKNRNKSEMHTACDPEARCSISSLSVHSSHPEFQSDPNPFRADFHLFLETWRIESISAV
jgi:hypothetical protein